MADYDSDSSGAEDIETGVTLGYATKDATGDDFSKLGGYPVSIALLPYLPPQLTMYSHGSMTQLFHLEPWQSAKSATGTSAFCSN